MPLHKKNATQRHFDIHTPLHTHTEAFTHRFFQRITEEALTQRSLYTEPLLHTEAFTHRKFPQKFLHREAFTHRSFYTQTPLHTEACTHGGFYTQKLLHREALHRAAFTRFKLANLLSFWMFGHHVMRKGYIWRWKIATFDVGQSFCVKGLPLTLENRNLHKFYFA